MLWKNGLAKTKEKELERRRKLSKIHKGKRYSPNTEIKEGQHFSQKTEFKKGKHFSLKTEFRKGQIPWNKGKPYLQLRGEKHPFWAGGKSRHRGIGWEFIRKKVWERDNYTCQLCGKLKKEIKGKLETHHIIPYKLSKDNSLNNLITLCTSCHKKSEFELWKEVKKLKGKKEISYTAASAYPIKIFFDLELLKSMIKDKKILARHIQMNFTNRCNLNCSFCSCSERDKSIEMPFEKVVETMQKFKELGCVSTTLTGGGEL